MPRATATETAERVEHLQRMILSGMSNTVCLAFMRQTWGVSRAQGYRLLKKAWAQIKDDIDESGIDRQELVVVNSNVDSRGWTGDEAEEP